MVLGVEPGAAVGFEGVSPFESPEQKPLSYWLNLNGDVRHNSTCRWYENTKRGRACAADEGKACGICGG